MKQEQEWFNLSKKDLMNQIKNSMSLKKFFEWWQDGDLQRFMELRFTDWKDADVASKKYKLFKYKTSVFIKNAFHLESIVREYSSKTNIWFGVNPKRPLRDSKGKYNIKQYDVNCKEIAFLFLDIDRVVKNNRAANNKELMTADLLCNKIIENLSKNGMACNYMKLCSGNGVQILFKLDVPFFIPQPTYDDKGQKHIENSLFKERKDVIRKGIGTLLSGFYVEGLSDVVEVDSTCFNMGRVAALHQTFNFKYKKPLPRGIVEFKISGTNEGLSDYLLKIKDKKTIKSNLKKEIGYMDEQLAKEFCIKESELDKNKLVQLMLNHQFPNGGINNTLWYALKLSFYVSGVSNEDSEYINIHERLKSIHNRSFSDNGLEKYNINNKKGPLSDVDAKFIPFIVNKYLRCNKICKVGSEKTFYHAPLFDVAPFGKNKYDITIKLEPKNLNSESSHNFTLNKSQKKDFVEDVKLLEREYNNIRQGVYLSDQHVNQGEITSIGNVFIKQQLFETGVSFLKSFKEKWEDEITAYMMKYYLEYYINYKRWN